MSIEHRTEIDGYVYTASIQISNLLSRKIREKKRNNNSVNLNQTLWRTEARCRSGTHYKLSTLKRWNNRKMHWLTMAQWMNAHAEKICGFRIEKDVYCISLSENNRCLLRHVDQHHHKMIWYIEAHTHSLLCTDELQVATNAANNGANA